MMFILFLGLYSRSPRLVNAELAVKAVSLMC
jgi:hypothetical protein